MSRRWHAGDTIQIPHAPLMRVVEGNKKRGDLRIEWWSSGRNVWEAVNMSVVAVLTDFFYENEDHLFPPSQGFMGGKYFMGYLNVAVDDGWEVADAKLHTEQRFKDER